MAKVMGITSTGKLYKMSVCLQAVSPHLSFSFFLSLSLSLALKKLMVMLEKSMWQGTQGGLEPKDLKKLTIANNHASEPGSY